MSMRCLTWMGLGVVHAYMCVCVCARVCMFWLELKSLGVQVWCWAFVQARKLGQEAQANTQVLIRKLLASSLLSFPSPSCFSSGVAGVSVLNMGSMARGRSMASGQPGLSGLTALEPAEEESCTGSAPAPAPGRHTHSHALLLI